MKQYVLLVGAIFGIAQFGSAAPLCATGTLTSYIGLGSTGCMIGNNTVTSFTLLTGLAGSTPISPMSITVTPFGSASLPELSFQTTATASAGNILDDIFTYQISGAGINMVSAILSGTSMTGDGGATLIKNLCRGGTFDATGVSGCSSGMPSTLVALGNSSDMKSFQPAYSIAVTDDFTLDGGLAGSASGGTFSNQFVVPEPGTMLLAGLGLAIAAFGRRRLGKCIDRQKTGDL